MNFKIILTLILIFTLFNILIAQQRYENYLFNFSIEKPMGKWKETESFNNFLKKIGGFEFTENNLVPFMKENFKVGFGGKRGLTLVKYYHKDGSPSGYHPTMSLGVSLLNYKNFEDFTKKVTKMKAYFKYGKVPKDLTFEVPPKTVEVSGIKSVYFVFTSSHKFESKRVKGRTIKCFIPMGEYYFVLNCHDFPGELECADIYERAISTIKIDHL